MSAHFLQRPRVGRRPFLGGLVTLLAAPCCAKGTHTTITEIWRTEATVSFRALLVVGVWSKDAGQRGRFEELTAMAFRNAGIPAMSAQTLIGDLYPYPREALLGAAASHDLDGALVIRLIGYDRTARVDVTGEPLGDAPRARSSDQATTPSTEQSTGQWTEHYRHVYEAEGVGPMKVARAESLLFEVATEALVWSGLSETFAPEDAADAVASYGNAMAKALIGEGLLAPS